MRRKERTGIELEERGDELEFVDDSHKGDVGLADGAQQFEAKGGKRIVGGEDEGILGQELLQKQFVDGL